MTRLSTARAATLSSSWSRKTGHLPHRERSRARVRRAGTNRAAVLRAAEDRLGRREQRVGCRLRVKLSTLYALLTRLVKDGVLQARTLPSGRSG